MVWAKLECGLVGIKISLEGVNYNCLEIMGRIFADSREFEKVNKESIAQSLNSKDDNYHEGMLNSYNLKIIDSAEYFLEEEYSTNRIAFQEMKEYALKDNRLLNGPDFKDIDDMKLRYSQ